MSFISLLSINCPHNWAYQGGSNDDTPLYQEFVLILAKSLRMHHPNETLHFLAINFTDEFAQDLLDTNPAIAITRIEKDFSEGSQQYYKGWLMTTKCAWILEILNSEKTPHIYLDCDVLIRKKLTPIQDWLNTGTELTCLHRPFMAKDKLYATGLMGLNPTPNIIDFLTLWHDTMQNRISDFMRPRPDGRSISGGQLTFSECLKSRKVQFRALPKSFNDGDLGKDSEVWHGHRGNKWDAMKTLKAELIKLESQKR